MTCNTVIIRAALSVFAVLLLSGCSSLDTRIRRNQSLFDSYPEDVRKSIRNGRIDVGYTRVMVEIALGRPDRIETERTAEGDVEYWSYFGYFSTYDHVWQYDAPRTYRGHDGRLYHYRPSMTARSVDIEQRHMYEALRIQFRDGAVTTIRRVQQ